MPLIILANIDATVLKDGKTWISDPIDTGECEYIRVTSRVRPSNAVVDATLSLSTIGRTPMNFVIDSFGFLKGNAERSQLYRIPAQTIEFQAAATKDDFEVLIAVWGWQPSVPNMSGGILSVSEANSDIADSSIVFSVLAVDLNNQPLSFAPSDLFVYLDLEPLQLGGATPYDPSVQNRYLVSFHGRPTTLDQGREYNLTVILPGVGSATRSFRAGVDIWGPIEYQVACEPPVIGTNTPMKALVFAATSGGTRNPFGEMWQPSIHAPGDYGQSVKIAFMLETKEKGRAFAITPAAGTWTGQTIFLGVGGYTGAEHPRILTIQPVVKW